MNPLPESNRPRFMIMMTLLPVCGGKLFFYFWGRVGITDTKLGPLLESLL